jgi:hypothetical protein
MKAAQQSLLLTKRHRRAQGARARCVQNRQTSNLLEGVHDSLQRHMGEENPVKRSYLDNPTRRDNKRQRRTEEMTLAVPPPNTNRSDLLLDLQHIDSMDEANYLTAT